MLPLCEEQIGREAGGHSMKTLNALVALCLLVVLGFSALDLGRRLCELDHGKARAMVTKRIGLKLWMM